MPGNYWVKLYQDILDDPKIGRLRVELKWRFIECLLVAGENGEEGILPTAQDMAWRLRYNFEQLETDLGELAEAGLIDMVDGRWRVTKFKKRQEPSKAALKQRRYRQRKKEAEKRKEREEETETEPEPYRYRNALRNGNVTVIVPEYLKTDAFDDAWRLWCNHLTEKNVAFTSQQVNLEMERLADMGHDEAIEAIKYSIRRGWKSIHSPSEHVQGSKRGKAAGAMVLDHIKRFGARRKLKADEDTLTAVRLSGGLMALGRLEEQQIVQTIAANFPEGVKA
jgi:hypothetical protein